MSSRLAWLVPLALFAGCVQVRASFVATDQSFIPRAPDPTPPTDFTAPTDRTAPAAPPPPTAPAPVVYVDRLPPFAYRSVGIIEVIATASAGLEQVMEAAARKGAEVGCDVVVDRTIHRVADSAPVRGPYWPAQYYAPPPPPPPPVITPAPAPTYAYVPPPMRREFICGIAVERAAVRPAATGI